MFEAHPVPQNVTEFEFHLVGDMTIKQFIYLASGIGLAYLTFALLASKVPLLAYPLIVILAGTGAALAFLPIQERPLDHWLGAYFRAIFQPTKRVYKSKLITKEDPLFKTRLQVFLNSRRNQFSGLNIPNKNVKSTPFSFNMNPISQQAQAAASPIIASAAPVSAPTSPAPSSPVLPTGSIPKDLSGGVISASPAQAPLPTKDYTFTAPPKAFEETTSASTVLGSASLSSISLPAQQTLPNPSTSSSTPLANSSLPPTVSPSSPVNTAPANPASQLPQQMVPTSTPVSPSPTPVNQPFSNEPAPSEDELKKTIEIAKQVHQVQQKIVKTEEQINLIRSKAATQDANPKEYLDQFHQLLGELQNLNQQAANLSQQVAVLTKEPAKQISVKPELVVKAKSIPTITLTSIPNVLNGIVTDSKGNYLDGSIILAHDKQGIPVRALKTNKLGQFVAATPLNNGIYTITIEKENLVFDTIEIELSGTVLKPILITSKPVAEGVVNG